MSYNGGTVDPNEEYEGSRQQRSPIVFTENNSKLMSPKTASKLLTFFGGNDSSLSKANSNQRSLELEVVPTMDTSEDTPQTLHARVLIDKVFDLELKRESLIKARHQHHVGVDARLFYQIDQQTHLALEDFTALFRAKDRDKPQLSLADLVRASLAVRLNVHFD